MLQEDRNNLLKIENIIIWGKSWAKSFKFLPFFCCPTWLPNSAFNLSISWILLIESSLKTQACFCVCIVSEDVTSKSCPFQIVEVGHFCGYRTDERSMALLQKLSDEIGQLELTSLPICPYPDLVCLAPFTERETETYYRVQVLYVSGDSAEVLLFQILQHVQYNRTEYI